MADKKYDGVIEAVHYRTDGQIDWVRAYLRRGPTWGDRVIMNREDLIKEMKAGKKMMLGQRIAYMAGTFDVSVPVKVSGADGKEVLFTSSAAGERDNLEGAPTL